MSAGTSSDETTSEASRIPNASAKPIWRDAPSLSSISVANDVASTSSAAAIAGATRRTASATASRTDRPASISSRRRAVMRML